jgi:hypothetical protein
MKYNYIILTVILVLIICLAPLIRNIEGFSGINDLTTPGTFPKSVDQAILDDYPQIGKSDVSNDNYNQIWWKYPVFNLGSYEQITNNLKYHYNPDDGKCVRAEFCGAIYHDKKNTKTNIISPLPPAAEGGGARVGYYRTEPNELYFSIPTNENILY